MSEPSRAPSRVPAEWEAREGTLLAWPPEHVFPGARAEVVDTFRALIRLLRGCEKVTLLVPPDERDAIARSLGGEDESLELEPLLVNDVWTRDSGPICAEQTGPEGTEAVFLDGGFNGWGAKYPHEMDRLIPTLLSRRYGVRRVSLPIALEGGAVEVNGRGDLLTTESVLLNPNRHNPERDVVERELRRHFGAERVHWLGRGLAGDDTDGHIDNLARFVAPGRIACPTGDLPSGHPDAETLARNRRALASLHTAQGPAEVIELPAANVTDRRGRRLPASYANFYLAPGLVIAPTFGENADDRALGILRELFPERRVAGLEARPLLAEGGAFHCITQPLRRTANAP